MAKKKTRSRLRKRSRKNVGDSTTVEISDTLANAITREEAESDAALPNFSQASQVNSLKERRNPFQQPAPVEPIQATPQEAIESGDLSAAEQIIKQLFASGQTQETKQQLAPRDDISDAAFSADIDLFGRQSFLGEPQFQVSKTGQLDPKDKRSKKQIEDDDETRSRQQFKDFLGIKEGEQRIKRSKSQTAFDRRKLKSFAIELQDKRARLARESVLGDGQTRLKNRNLANKANMELIKELGLQLIEETNPPQGAVDTPDLQKARAEQPRAAALRREINGLVEQVRESNKEFGIEVNEQNRILSE